MWGPEARYIFLQEAYALWFEALLSSSPNMADFSISRKFAILQNNFLYLPVNIFTQASDF